ncbi:PilZ domain-containing protein [uncultured Erythrobacter sp.]|uniref:PilZ domain-containing protein n=1 Tax=uncultured Erythrobacter sp. TaxID=263913 RepID=UPI002619BF62|nr:PilZ domain-containing protein [uncultured Erythrobacter sp.]
MTGRDNAALEAEMAWDMPDASAEIAQVDTVSESIPNTGRRNAPRLRLSLPARLVSVERTHQCILMNLSRTGAQIAILESLREGEGAVLKCGKIDQFVIVSRGEFGLNALTFEEELSDEMVLHIRRYHENFEERERRALVETARKWVSGESDDERAI